MTPRSKILTTLLIALSLAASLARPAHADPIAHWAFDYPPIGKDKDAFPDTIFQRNAVIENKSVVTLYTGTDAPFGKALTLNGTSGSFLTAPATLGPFFNKSFSFAAWIKIAPDAAGKTNPIVADWPTGKLAFIFAVTREKGQSKDQLWSELRSPVQTENKKKQKYNATVMHSVPEAEVTPDAWHHVVWTWDRSDATHGIMTTYLDGQKVGEQKNRTGNNMTSVQVVSNGQGFKIGEKEDNHSLFNGSLDEVWLFDTVLTPDQVTNLMKTNDISKTAVEVAAATPTPTPAPEKPPTPVAVAPTPAPVEPTTAPAAVAEAPTPPPATAPAVVEEKPPVVAVAPTPTPPAPPQIVKPAPLITQVMPPAIHTASHYTPERIAGIIASACIAAGLSGFLMWAKGERAKMRSGTRA